MMKVLFLKSYELSFQQTYFRFHSTVPKLLIRKRYYILFLIYLPTALQPLWTLAAFQFLNLYTVGGTPWTGDNPVARPLPAHRTRQTQNKHTQTSMPLVGFEPMIPVLERVKTVHALDLVATVIDTVSNTGIYFSSDKVCTLYPV
jgi:hypothetical protein